MKLEPSQTIDNRYRIIERLGQGGMGVVWKATDQQAGGDVVIKMPLDGRNPVVLQRFQEEVSSHNNAKNDGLNIADSIRNRTVVTKVPEAAKSDSSKGKFLLWLTRV